MGLKIYSSILDIHNLSSTSIAEALRGVPSDYICGIVCCGTSDNVEYYDLLRTLKSSIYEALGRVIPVTLVPQYLLPKGGLSLDIYTIQGAENLRIEQMDGICHGIIEGGCESMLFIEGIPAPDFGTSVAEQSEQIFDRLDRVLSSYGFRVDDIIRQWNYIGNIVSYRNGKQNYQEFNDARTRYYNKGEWHNGYPAATGIGTSSEGIIVGAIAYRSTDQIYPIDNPLQVAAHIYSKRVLIDREANAPKSTPKFERAKLIENERGACCFVSGTAAIRGEESVDAASAKMQTIKTIENIAHLVSEHNLIRHGCKPYALKPANLYVYIKRVEDFEQVQRVVEEVYPQVAAVYTLADICRDELLVEIEEILTT